MNNPARVYSERLQKMAKKPLWLSLVMLTVMILATWLAKPEFEAI
jgi:hypothetical protein